MLYIGNLMDVNWYNGSTGNITFVCCGIFPSGFIYIYIKQWPENQYSDDYHNDV